MKNGLKKFLAAVIAVYIVFVGLPVHSASAAPATYSKSSNSGTRDEVCTSLSGTSAGSYYTGSYTYEALSQLSSSSLKTTLNKLLTETHKKTSSYSDCKEKANVTDCENNNTSGIITLYTSYETSHGEYNSGSGWNREHVWPKSLGGFETSGAGADLHHIRPSENKTNGDRGNLKYGNVSSGSASKGNLSGITGGTKGSYYEPLDNVKGDVARIILYVHVRYYNVHSQCGSVTNVFQSVDVLLEWCEMDPVDTWEMGRNEVVQAIQGNRNVFIDYPELAWTLFGKEAPDNMVTPSGNASDGNVGSGGNTGNNTGNNTGDNTGNNTGDNTGVGVTPIATIKASAEGQYTAEGVVAARNAQSYLLRDNTGVMLVFLKTTPSVNIGDKVRVSGATTTYGGAVQFGQDSTTTKIGTESVSYPTPKKLSGSDCDAYLNGITMDYVKVVGTLSTSGSTTTYYNLAIDGASITGSITYPENTSELNAMTGKLVEVTGYVTGVTGSSAKYLNIMATGVKEYDPNAPDDNTGDNVGDNTGDNVGDNTGDNVGDNTGDNVGDNTGDEKCAHTTKRAEGIIAAGCGIQGYTGDTYCGNCGELLAEGTVIPATSNHEWGDWLATDNALYKFRVCSICGEVEDVKLQCMHSQAEVRGEREATCLHEGYTGGTFCAICQTLIVSGDVIPMVDHSYGDPVETADGKLEKSCIWCGRKEYEEANATSPLDFSSMLSGCTTSISASSVLAGVAIAVAVAFADTKKKRR